MDKKQSAKRLQEVIDETDALQAVMESDAANVTPENEVKFKSLLAEGEKIMTNAKNGEILTGMKSFLSDPVGTPAGGDGEFAQKFTGAKSVGEMFVESDLYKSAIKSGTVPNGLQAGIEIKGFLRSPQGAKAIFDSTGTGLSTTTNYIGNGGAPVMIEQQRLTVADLFSSGETTLNAIPYIRETSFVNAANTVAEGGLKPEATFVTEAVSAPVKKIAITAKVTDEMYADFPMMRDYVNNRLTFMIAQKEEQQLVSGLGTGSQIQGVLSVAGIQTQARATDSVADAIHKAMTKIRTIGFFEPDAVVIHPNDYQKLRLSKDANGQYFGGWSHYTVCYLSMVYDGMTYVLAEYAARQTSVEDNAKGIIEMLGRFNLSVNDLSNFVAGTDVFAQRGAKNAETIADQYRDCGIFLTEANTDRINGAGKILKLLGDAERGITPKIKISRNCVRLLECLPSLEHDPHRPEDVKKVDTDESGNGGDDFYDSLRYLVQVSDSKGIYF